MGNRGSSPTANDATPAQQEVVEDASGVFISPGLLNEAVTDFQSTVLKEEWERRQKYLLARGNKRRMEDIRREEELKQHMDDFRASHRVVHAQLDQRLDETRAKFADAAVEMQHVLGQLHQKHSRKMMKEKKEKPCLQQRTNLTLCLKNENETAEPCDDFVEALDRCVTKTIANQQ